MMKKEDFAEFETDDEDLDLLGFDNIPVISPNMREMMPRHNDDYLRSLFDSDYIVDRPKKNRKIVAPKVKESEDQKVERLVEEKLKIIRAREIQAERDANICYCHGQCRCNANKPATRNFLKNNTCYCHGQCRCGYNEGMTRAKIADGYW